jgi:D-alanine-D-alanine ligase
MEIGIAYDLKSDFQTNSDDPEDRFEEYDNQGTINGIAAAIEACGHRPRFLGGGRRFIEQVLAKSPELVFNIAEGYGTRSREAHIPSVLEMLHIPYTHSDPLTLAATLDKAIAKRLVAAQGWPTPGFAVIGELGQLGDLRLRFPVITKPLFEGSSMGIRKASRVADEVALHEQIERLLSDYQQPVLVEEFCNGPEFTIGVLGNGSKAGVIGVMEIRPRQGSIDEFVYSLEVKRNYLEEVEYCIPPNRPAALLKKVERLALHAYRALDCRDVARVDVRVDADGQPKFIEINPLPGLNPITSDIVILSTGAGISYDTLISRIIAAACERYGI